MISLPNKTGVQVLWHNPDGFRPKSGEYVKIQCPWLSKGGNEWHPFSIYLKESTEMGLKSFHDISIKADDDNSLYHIWEDRVQDEHSITPFDHEGTNIISLKVYIEMLLESEDHHDNTDHASESPSSSSHYPLKSRFVAEAREDLSNKYKTTQVFICPLGDWTRGLINELEDQKQLRACWVRGGPYISPYFVAQNFSHLVLTATGIGITPALGVLGQYPGNSRTKILIWSTRDKDLLTFIAPLVKDAHLAVIFYTGKEKLSFREIITISSFGNIYIQQSRPKSFPDTIRSIILGFENHLNSPRVGTFDEIELKKIAAWCIFYCGGSEGIESQLQVFSKMNGIGFASEKFDW